MEGSLKSLGRHFGNSRQTGSGDNAGVIGSSLAQTDALTELLIEKGLITEAEFMKKLSAERAGYRAMLQRVE